MQFRLAQFKWESYINPGLVILATYIPTVVHINTLIAKSHIRIYFKVGTVSWLIGKSVHIAINIPWFVSLLHFCTLCSLHILCKISQGWEMYRKPCNYMLFHWHLIFCWNASHQTNLFTTMVSELCTITLVITFVWRIPKVTYCRMKRHLYLWWNIHT